jgi:hypothetical protein
MTAHYYEANGQLLCTAALRRVVHDEKTRLYEKLKADWARRNPQATPAEYEAFVLALVEEVGI